MRTIRYFNGEEITDDVILKMNSITERSRRPQDVIYFDECLEGVENLTACRGTFPEQENIVLGEDWFIGYVDWYDSIEFTMWYGVDKADNKVVQTAEMLSALRSVLSSYPDRKFTGYLKHFTSYPIYKKYEEHGYIKTREHTEFIDCGAPVDMDMRFKKEQKCKNADFSLEVGDWVLHGVEFEVTDKFQKRYCKK